MRILVIDDDDVFRDMLAKTLSRLGHSTIEARDGVEGLSLFAKDRIDLVVTDLIMPEKEGIETIIEIRRRDPKAKIIAMSGGGRGAASDYLSFALSLGAAATLEKPFALEALQATIAKVMAT